MILKIKENFNREDLLKKFSKGKTQQVSFFHKFDNYEDLKDKKFTFVDFEFSVDYQIYEMAVFDVVNEEIVNYNFLEFKMPIGTKYFDPNQKFMKIVNEKFNQNKIELTEDYIQYIIDIFEKTDYLVSHNYIAELQCYNRLKFNNNEKYDTNNFEIFNNGKVICTKCSFPKKYFENFGVKSLSNGELSTQFSWNVNLIKNNGLNFTVSNDKLEFNEEFKFNNINLDEDIHYHNALYDIVVTYTNFLTLSSFLKD